MPKPLTAEEKIVITRTELLCLREAEKKYREAVAAQTAAENIVKPLRLEFATKVLGITTSDELRAMSPEEVERLLQKRAKQCEFETVRGAPQFRFVKTSSGRYPAWKSLFISRLGEAVADSITAETPMLYSYIVQVD